MNHFFQPLTSKSIYFFKVVVIHLFIIKKISNIRKYRSDCTIFYQWPAILSYLIIFLFFKSTPLHDIFYPFLKHPIFNPISILAITTQDQNIHLVFLNITVSPIRTISNKINGIHFVQPKSSILLWLFWPDQLNAPFGAPNWSHSNV